MKKTKNYAMPYPEQDDYFNVEDFQDMMVSVDDLMKKLSDSGAQISSDAEHLYNQTKAQMDNIQKRMNAFTALRDGSTTGDAELKDIRVAYDGKEYGNAGEAVREQASDIHKALFGAGASIWSKAKSESTKYVAETKGICILNERFTAAGVVTKISRGTFAENESTLNLDRECSAYIVEFEKNPGTVYMPSAEIIKIVSTTKIIFEANGNARCWIPVEKGQYLAVDSTATAYTYESNHVPYMLYNQANKTLDFRGFGATGSTKPVDPYSLALEYKLEYDMDDTGIVKQIDANRKVADSLKEEIDDIAVKEYAEMQVEFIEGSYIPYFNQHTITENSNAKYLKISCKSGEKYKIHTKNFYDGRAYALYSGENEYATDYYPGTKLTEVTEEIVIPEDVTTLVVNSELSFPAKVEKYVINNKNYYAEKKIMESEIMRNKHEREYFYSSCINLINSENLLPDKGVIFQVGRKYEIIDSPGYYALKSLIPVQEGETYTLLTKYARAVIYDFNLTVIDSKYEGADPVVFTIPTGGAFLSCFYQNSKPISGLYKGNRIGIDFISPNIFLGKTTSINGLNWCAFGDSLTDKNTLKDEESGTRNYVDFIQWSTGLNVTNLGKGGTGYMADNGYQQSFIDRISQIPTDSNIITCFGSFNDASKAKEHIGTIDDDTKDTLYGCLNLFVTGVQNHCPDSIIGLITPTPWSVYNNVNGDSEFSEQYVDAIINIAKKYGLPLLDLYHSSGLRPWNSAFKEKYFRDDTGDGTAEGVHPLQETHRKYIAPQVENFIRSIANTYISISY